MNATSCAICRSQQPHHHNLPLLNSLLPGPLNQLPILVVNWTHTFSAVTLQLDPTIALALVQHL